MLDDATFDGDQRKVTALLKRIGGGEPGAADALLPIVYGELRGIARGIFSSRPSGQMLQPTALVHEAWIKLAGNLGSLNDRRHFFVVASHAMRQVLTDHARAQSSQKRGGGRERVTLDTSISGAGGSAVELVALSDCLDRLAQLNEVHARVVELRIFGGMTIAETATALDRSRRAVDSDWAMAKAWLRRELEAAR